ncbi:hypothetical protein BC830DRAFT_373153 [Chytriomyces sp. MP71]|nr:hypothetical protein BC830DRAFT_373153 [Chytriomyces sp. MP71]
MMPDFKNLANDARVAIKRGVKQYLQHELGDAFDECLMMTGGGADGSAAKQTYGVPEHLIAEFQVWVYVELKKCFPDLVVLDPSA